MKGAAATGAAAVSLGALGGTASAQQNIRRLNVRDINFQEGLINVNVSNVNILRDFDEIVVTVIGGDVVGRDINILRFEDEVNILNDLTINVNDNVVQVVVLALSEAGDIVAAGSGATNDA